MTNSYSAAQDLYRRRAWATRVAACLTVAACALAAPAAAQSAAEQASAAALPADDPAPVEAAEITVTGTRIVRDGYDAPTPVSVISTKELRTEAPANIADFVNTLPSVRGSSTAFNSSGSLSNGLAGVASINLRALGATRTLVLFDGQRSVASATSGVVDVNTFPQALIERVEVVTGGASSAYGSDAVSGVVNFVLNKDFKGIRTEYEYGVTTYGDVPNHKFSLTGGAEFADGKGHVLISGEHFTQKGVDTIDRDWNNAGFFQIDNPAFTPTNGQPQRLVQAGIGPGQFTPGGLISTGPLRGTVFGPIDPATGRATLSTLTFGPTNGQWMVGGDYLITRVGHISSNSLAPDEKRSSLFGRVSYEFARAFELYGQFAYSLYRGTSFYQQTPSTGVVIRADNAFVPDAFRARLAANNLTSFTIGTSNAGVPPAGSDNSREIMRFVAGARGEFDMIGGEWTWDGYYQKGITATNELLTNTWNNARLALAQDAVFAPAGNAAGIPAGRIVCRSTLTSPNNGCVPINRLGIGGVTPEAVNYIFNDGNQPLRRQRLVQSVAALNLSNDALFSNWAGPVSIAVGAEYREESVNGTVDPQFNSGWLYGNYLVTKGRFTVKEAYLETVFPIFSGMDFNGAFRVTDYSTSGTVTTWKTGLTWQPIDDVKFRGTYSRDIRAPNLGELFAPGTARTNTVNVPLASGSVRTDQFTEQTVGNPLLRPEIAKTLGAGVIFTPSFIPGLSLSVDYYDIKLSGAINTLTAQATVTLCYEQSNRDACNNITTAAGLGVTTGTSPITGIRLVPFNYVSQRSQGIDIEASYRRPLFGGNLTLRALATHYISVLTDNGIDAPFEAAGVNYTGGVTGGNTPRWVYRLTQGFDIGRWSFNFVQRGLSNGVYDNSFIECTTACPPSTVQNRTINNNRIAGAIYADFQTNYTFDIGPTKSQVFLSIRNIFDTDPVLVGNGPTGNNTPAYPQTNRNLYDFLGRTFRMGIRISY